MKKALFSIAVLLCLAFSLRADTYTPFLTEEQYLQQLWDTIVDRYDVEGLEFVANDMSQKLNGEHFAPEKIADTRIAANA